MAKIIRTPKPLSVNPLKASQPVGASLAFLGLNRALPLMHGSQGCTAFAKVFLVRHFREPIPLQTTAMDQIATVMGADTNVIQALATIAEKNKPAVIGLCTTGLSETQGTDIRRCVHEFRSAYPQYVDVHVVPVNSNDTVGCLETGFALAVEAIIDSIVEKSAVAGCNAPHGVRRPKQVNVLASSMLTPGDIEAIKDWIEAFGLRPIVLPDLSDSLDGHLVDAGFSPLTVGGTPASEIVTLGEAAATLVIGASLRRAADKLKDKTGVPDYRFDGLMGLEACDAFTQALAEISGQPVPEKIERQRAQLQDAMVDSHFMTGFTSLALAGDPDLVCSFARFLVGMGAEIAVAVSPVKAHVLEALPIESVIVGDLEDLERAAEGRDIKLVIANSHAAPSAERLGVPLLRAGFPQYDWVGGYARTWVGYRGARQALFDIANLILGQHHDIPPYRSLFWQDGPRREEAGSRHDAPAAAGLVH
jgi:nitrogenase molybdenum-iron protein NifN